MLYYAEGCNEFAGAPNSVLLSPGNTAPFEVISQRWQTVGNTVSDLTGPRFEPQTSRSRDERVIACPTRSKNAQSWTALFRAFSSHRQPSASLIKGIPRLDKTLGRTGQTVTACTVAEAYFTIMAAP